MKSWAPVIIACIAFNAHAQPVDVSDMTGQPLMYMKDGVVHGCGLRIMGGTEKADGEFRMFDVSLSVYAAGVTILKAVSYDVTPAEAKSNKPARRVNVVSAWVKAPNEPATKPIGAVRQSESEVALLYTTQVDALVAVLKAQSQGAPMNVGIRRLGESAERIQSGPIALSSEERKQLSQCISELRSQIK